MDRDEIDDDVFEQLDAEDTLDNTGVGDPLDEGYSPGERPLAVDDWGTTAREEAEGESLDGRLARVTAVLSDVDGGHHVVPNAQVAALGSIAAGALIMFATRRNQAVVPKPLPANPGVQKPAAV